MMNITADTAMNDYLDLCKDNIKIRTGSKCMNFHFFELTLNTKSKRGQSFNEFLLSNEIRKPHYVKFLEKKGNTMRSKYDAFSVYSSSVNLFKPFIAKQLYQTYNPKTILDFSCGWGGRCIGAMASNINYIGFDTNKNLKKAYDQLSIYPTKSKVEIHYEDSSLVDYSQYTYDMVFTSPPYFRTKSVEVYENMPIYKNRVDFNESFLFPVIRNTFAHLSKGGVYALNIPTYMYDDVRSILGDAHFKRSLHIAKTSYEPKHGSNYSEYIYIWINV